MDALIGHTGFVGSNLREQHEFDVFFNSRNIEEIKGGEFDLLVCAGVNAVKWYANLHPEEDKAAIQILMDCLSTVKAKHFILISTIDVYSSFIPSPDESSIPDETRQDAYGKNRYQLECWVRKHFPSSLIVRLPALFANGLKKNFIFDLMHPKPVLVKDYVWDPTEPTATRILMMTCWKEKEMEVKEKLCFMHDALKNVTFVFGEQHERKARYEYAPFGGMLTAEGDVVHTNKFRFSCEYTDDELGLVYYNYRHLNPTDGRWINRDPIAEQGGWNLYAFVRNNGIKNQDHLGRDFCPWLVEGTKHNANVIWQGTKRTAIVALEKVDRINKKYKIVTRTAGALQVIGGGFEASAGAIGIAAPEPLTTAGGVVLFIHGSDVASAGIRVVITGEYDSTMTHKAITKGAETVGIPSEIANNIATGAEVALGAKAFSTPVTKCCPTVLVESTEIEVTTVSRWGSDLTPNSWVMEGTPTVWNYMWSGKWQPMFKNKFAPIWNVKSYIVPRSSLSCPSGKGIDGFMKRLVPAKQRIYTPHPK